MIFKMIVLGHVLLASAFENKALRALQADVDTLEKTLKGGDIRMHRRRIDFVECGSEGAGPDGRGRLRDGRQ